MHAHTINSKETKCLSTKLMAYYVEYSETTYNGKKIKAWLPYSIDANDKGNNTTMWHWKEKKWYNIAQKPTVVIEKRLGERLFFEDLDINALTTNNSYPLKQSRMNRILGDINKYALRGDSTKILRKKDYSMAYLDRNSDMEEWLAFANNTNQSTNFERRRHESLVRIMARQRELKDECSTLNKRGDLSPETIRKVEDYTRHELSVLEEKKRLIENPPQMWWSRLW